MWPIRRGTPGHSAPRSFAAQARADDLLIAVDGAVAALWHLAAWRLGRSIYRFDADLAASLTAVSVGVGGKLRDGGVPPLPEWGPYILLPESVDSDDGVALFGVFAIPTGRPAPTPASCNSWPTTETPPTERSMGRRRGMFRGTALSS